MSTLTIELPAIIKISNTGSKPQSFQPYHENFTVSVPEGIAVEFEVATAGQYFYYMKQAVEGLAVEELASFDVASDSIIVIDLPSMVTLTNVSSRIKTFRPYRENFDVELGAGDVVKLEATTTGQVLYYTAQADSDLTVSHEAKPADNA